MQDKIYILFRNILMKAVNIFISLGIALLSPLAVANEEANTHNGQLLFKTHCSACHGIQGGMDMSKRVAPPIAAVRMHYIGSYTDKMSFIDAIANWVEKPDQNNTFMRGAIRRFNIMPPISISRSNAETIAAYIYDGDIESPAGFKEHVNQMHGKNR